MKPRWLFLKVHTNAGIVGLGEPLTEGRALTCAEAVKEIEPYLVGKDPRRVAHHWQAIYRHAFYRGGPILTSALSGVDQALWDIKGKALGVPVYELLGGPTRDRVRVYSHASRVAADGRRRRRDSRRSRPVRPKKRPSRYIETPAAVEYAAERFAELRKAMGHGDRYRHRFPRRHQPGHRQAAHQGAGTVPADVHRRAVPGAEPRRHGRDRARNASCPSPPASGSSPSGASARCSRNARPR